MPFTTFADDQVLTAAATNRFFVQQHSVIKSADETVTNSTTFQNDDELVVPLLANSQYFIEFFLIYDTIQAADIKIQFTGPAGCTFDWSHGGLGTSATTSVGAVSRNYRNIGGTGTIGGPAAAAGTNAVIPGEGRAVTAGTAGNLQLQWAQNTLNVTGSVMKIRSVIIAQRLTV
jgi:hypothetical protein